MKTSDPSMKKVSSITIVSKRGKGLAGNVFPRLIGEIVAQINRPENFRAGVHIAGPPMFLYIDGSQDPKSLAFEVAFPVAGAPKLDPGFDYRTLAETKVVAITCMGPYKELQKDTYGELFKYAAQHQYAPSGPLREIYLNNPHETPEGQLVTELQLPVTG